MENYTGHDCEYSGQLQQLKRLTYDKSPNLLKSPVERFKMCTDQHSIEHFVKALYKLHACEYQVAF